jgi:dipeptidyl aminopeptidase/acylaminoacyl peptidase
MQEGFIRNPILSPNKKYLAYNFSKIATPDEVYLYDLELLQEKRLSYTIPKEFSDLKLKPQKIRKIRSRDRKFDIYANVFIEKEEKRPLVVFVHGAGILQNVMNGWTPHYHREYLFNHMLTQQGYHVIDVDYRGSEGYGHDFATDVYSHLGKKELEDIVSFIDELAKEGLVDKENVGIYGGSYGGFMASYAIEFEPNLFKAAAALRSVFNWENYYYTNEWYTRARLENFEDHKEWYKRSSPLYHTDKIKNKLLVLHGMLDDNVPFQDAVQMIQKLIDGKSNFDLMMYPLEKHGFSRPSSWEDEYKRIYKLFEENLK